MLTQISVSPSQRLLSREVSWEEALREFLLHKQAVYAAKTVRYYRIQLTELVRWAEAEGIPFSEFGKRHMDRYTASRIAQGKARLTLYHDGICAKNFFAWCAKNDLLDRSKLSEYEVHNAPKPHKHMPTDEEVAALLRAIAEYWDPEKHPVSGIRSMPGPARIFHRTRNAAIFMGLIDTACRIGEALNLKVGDVKLTEASVVIREAKGKEPRALPIGPEWKGALQDWLRVRTRVMKAVPPEEDEGWLFVSETGGRLDEIRILETLRRLTTFAGLPKEIALHSLRRYSLNKLAKHNLLMAQAIAGHKDTKTTLGYTRLDPEFVRATHREASPLGSVMSNRNHPPKKRRLV
jgi:site-specific recombinase XerD